MPDLMLTGVEGDKKIQAIKGLRAMTNWSLYDAKQAIDGLPAHPVRIANATTGDAMTAGAHSIRYEWVQAPIEMRVLEGWLSRFPDHMSVGDLRAVVAALMPPRSVATVTEEAANAS